MTDLALFESLLECKTVSDLHAKTGAITQILGFDHFIYGVQANTPVGEPYQFVLSGYPENWRKIYCDADYESVDPVLHHCIRSVVPVLWDNLSSLPQASRRLMEEAKLFGLANGVTCPLRGLGSEIGLLSVAVEKNSKIARKHMASSQGTIQLFANYLHESIHRVVLSGGSVINNK